MIFKRVRVIAVAIALTFVVNFAISQVVDNGGTTLPMAPRPELSALDNGGTTLPMAPRP